jgi:hypothetical protein
MQMLSLCTDDDDDDDNNNNFIIVNNITCTLHFNHRTAMLYTLDKLFSSALYF